MGVCRTALNSMLLNGGLLKTTEAQILSTLKALPESKINLPLPGDINKNIKRGYNNSKQHTHTHTHTQNSWTLSPLSTELQTLPQYPLHLTFLSGD
jgi:hypothetical protein